MNKDGSRTRQADGEVEYNPPSSVSAHPNSQENKRMFRPLQPSTSGNVSPKSDRLVKSERVVPLAKPKPAPPKQPPVPTTFAHHHNEMPTTHNQNEEEEVDLYRVAQEQMYMRKHKSIPQQRVEVSYIPRGKPAIVDDEYGEYADAMRRAEEMQEEGYGSKKKPMNALGYKPHTLEEYKMINIPIKLGGLGPDLQNEELKEKQEKRMKMLEYSRNIARTNNTKINVSTKSPQSPEEREDRYVSSVESPKKHSGNSNAKRKTVVEKKEVSARQKALEFASKIPKPPVRQQRAEENGGSGGSGNKHQGKEAGPSSHMHMNSHHHHHHSYQDDDDDEMYIESEPRPLTELELLELKHQREREWMEREFRDFSHDV